MKKIKKLVSFLIVTVMSVCLFAGCGSQQQANKLKTITVWTSETHSKTVIEEMIAEWNKNVGAKKNVKIEYKAAADMGNKIDLAATTGELPDFIGAGNMKMLADEGHIIALEDVKGGAELVEKYKSHINPNAHRYNGKTYRIPFKTTLHALLYNKQMFIDAGIVDENGNAKPPKTYSELIEYADKLTNKSKNEFGMIIPIGWGAESFRDCIVPMTFASTGVDNGYDARTGTYDYETLNRAIETILKIKENGSFVPGADSLNNDAARARFAQGKIGMKFGYSFDVGVLNDQFPASFEFGVAEIPVDDEAEVLYKQPMAVGQFLMMNKESVEKYGEDLMMEIYKLFHDDEWLVKYYDEGVYIPCNSSIIDDIEYKGAKQGWQEFGDLLSVSVARPAAMPKYLSESVKAPDERWVDDIWTGKYDYKEITKEYTKQANEGIEKYKEMYPNEDLSIFVMEDYDATR